MDEVATTDVVEAIKSGEMCMRTAFSRTEKGLKLTFKAHPRVEEFFRNLSASDPSPVLLTGRHWEIVESGQELLAYEDMELFRGVQVGNAQLNQTGRLDLVGGPLRDSSGIVNLSYFRLVGISQGNGVSFLVRGVWSLAYLERQRSAIRKLQQNFYISYIRPTDLSTTLSSQEIAF